MQRTDTGSQAARTHSRRHGQPRDAHGRGRGRPGQAPGGDNMIPAGESRRSLLTAPGVRARPDRLRMAGVGPLGSARAPLLRLGMTFFKILLLPACTFLCSLVAHFPAPPTSVLCCLPSSFFLRLSFADAVPYCSASEESRARPPEPSYLPRADRPLLAKQPYTTPPPPPLHSLSPTARLVVCRCKFKRSRC
jgi:hypothetical protein